MYFFKYQNLPACFMVYVMCAIMVFNMHKILHGYIQTICTLTWYLPAQCLTCLLALALPSPIPASRGQKWGNMILPAGAQSPPTSLRWSGLSGTAKQECYTQIIQKWLVKWAHSGISQKGRVFCTILERLTVKSFVVFCVQHINIHEKKCALRIQ